MIKLKSLLQENTATELIEQVKYSLYEYEGYSCWNEFVDNQKLGDCQGIVSSIIREFPQFKKRFGSIVTDEPYYNSEEDMFGDTMTHHWVSLNGIPYEFSKGTLKDYIHFDNLYDVNVEDLSIYNRKDRMNENANSDISQEISNFERQLTSKYRQYLEDLYFYYDDKNNSIFISDIYMKPQFKGKGWGTKIMNEICQFADSKKLAIALIPATDNLKSNGIRRLVKFYRSFGFVENNGMYLRNEFDDMSMYRLPK